MATTAAYAKVQGKVLTALKGHKGQECTISELAKELGIKGRKTVGVTAATRAFANDPECPVQRVVKNGKPAFRYSTTAKAAKAKAAPKTAQPVQVQTVASTDLHLVQVTPAEGEVVFVGPDGKVWFARPLSVTA